SSQAFRDAAKYCELEKESFLSSYAAAIIFGEAALKEPRYETAAIEHLSQAIANGMPISLIKKYQRPLKRLMPYVDAVAVVEMRRAAPCALDFRPPEDPPTTADWDAFQKTFGDKRR